MVYLKDVSLEEALNRLSQALEAAGLGGILSHETIWLDENALGRTLANPLIAKISSPHYHSSAMDGFAVRAMETQGAGPSTPVQLEVSGQAQYCDTGDPLPMEFDAVIPIEQVEALDKKGIISGDIRSPAAIRIRAAVAPWQHIRPMGEDMMATEMVLPPGHVMRPADLAAAAACGHAVLEVAKAPRVAILPTGSELVVAGSTPEAGQIVESNSIMLAAQVNDWGGIATRFEVLKDDEDLLVAAVERAATDHDLVIINAGSSAGAEDFTASAVGRLGQVLVHGVAVRPGHPVILGIIERERRSVPVIGVPGYPVSAALTGEIFVEPLLARWLGRQANQPDTIEATLTRKVTSPAGDDDYLRVSLAWVGGRLLAAPLGRGAGVLTSLVRADGIAILPRGTQGKAAGEPVRVRLYRSRREISQTLLAVGSHDLTLDLIAKTLSKRDRRLASASVGSQAGLVALNRGDAHIAGSHLLDPETGDYNLPFLPRYAPGLAVNVIGLVYREQGMMVARGNPLGLSQLGDLGRPGLRFVNRQRGSGTRVLLDYHLAQAGLEPEQIAGYEREEYTHLGVAAAVAAGRADVGLGVAGAAHALGLDFVPLFRERYDIIVPREFYSDPLLAPLWETLADPALKQEIESLPGYDAEPIGKLLAEVN